MFRENLILLTFVFNIRGSQLIDIAKVVLVSVKASNAMNGYTLCSPDWTQAG